MKKKSSVVMVKFNSKRKALEFKKSLNQLKKGFWIFNFPKCCEIEVI